MAKLTPSKIPVSDQPSFHTISRGYTKGIFQLESMLGKKWAKKLQPENLHDQSALIALMRPGPLHTGMAQKFVDVKNGDELEEYLDEKLKPILEQTNSCFVYQEQLLEIARDLAGFSLQRADELREAVGKKKAKLVEKIKPDFLDGCEKNGIDRKVAEQIFSWIEASASYLFNRAHSAGYALLGQRTAYLKTHFPAQFFCASLIHSRNCQKPLTEIRDMIHEAKLYGIRVLPPKIGEITTEFTITGKNLISYGMGHAKHIGTKSHKHLDKFKGVDTIQKFFSVIFTQKVPSKIVEALVKAGLLDHFGVPRVKLLQQYSLIRKLTDKEMSYVMIELLAGTTIKEILQDIISKGSSGKEKVCSNKNRIEAVKDILKQITSSDDLEDSSSQKAGYEQEIIGIALTASEADDFKEESTHDCYQAFMERDTKTEMKIVGVVEKATIIECTKGKSAGEEMMFLSISDNSCRLDEIVVFPSNLTTTAKKDVRIGCIISASCTKSARGSVIAKKLKILKKAEKK